MSTDRKRVTICSHSEALAGALRLLLEDFTVDIASDPSAVPSDADVLVWSFDGDLSGDEIEPIAQRVPTLIIGNTALLIDAVDAGCRGFLLPSAPVEEIRDSVRVIAEGGAVMPPDLLGTLLRHLVERRRTTSSAAVALEELTEREREVFRLAAHGTRKEGIGEALFISPATARTHLQRLYRKLDVHSQAELIALAVRIGEFDTEEDM